MSEFYAYFDAPCRTYSHSGNPSIAFTPLIVSYTVEILPFAIRAKGFTIFNFAVSLSLIFNQYVNPVALDKIGWRYYVRCFTPYFFRSKSY